MRPLTALYTEHIGLGDTEQTYNYGFTMFGAKKQSHNFPFPMHKILCSFCYAN